MVYLPNGHLVYFVASLEYFSQFGLMSQEKSGNPADEMCF
jgi:hypothetical protein